MMRQFDQPAHRVFRSWELGRGAETPQTSGARPEKKNKFIDGNLIQRSQLFETEMNRTVNRGSLILEVKPCYEGLLPWQLQQATAMAYSNPN